MSVLKEDISKPFGGDELIGFLDIIIGKLKPNCLAKPAVSNSTVTAAIKVLVEYGQFNYREKFEVRRGDRIRIHTFLDNDLKEKRITNDLGEKRMVGLHEHGGPQQVMENEGVPDISKTPDKNVSCNL